MAQNIFGSQPTYQFGGFIRYPGQVPRNPSSVPLNARPRLDPEIEASLMQRPPGVTLDRMLDRPVLRVQDTVSNLGLTKALEATLSLRIQKEAATAQNQLVFQKAINATMQETGLPSDLAGVINARATRFYRTTLQKSGRSELFTIAELSELKKGRPFLKPTKTGKLPQNPRSAAKHEANVTANKKVLGIKHVTESVEGEAHREFDIVKGPMDAAESFTIDPDYLSERYANPQGAGYDVERPAQLRNLGTVYPKLHGKVGEKARVAKLSKADGPKGQFQEVGGAYVAKVKKDGKTRYYYDEDKYKKEHGEHISGDQARVRHIHSEVHRIAHEAGPAGHDVTAYRDLVQKHGARPVHEAVRNHVDQGNINFQGGKFVLAKKPENEKPKTDKKKLKKSETFFIKG